MRIDHRRRHVPVPEQLLNRPDIVPGLKQVRREAVPQCMTRNALADPGSDRRPAHRALYRGLVQVMPDRPSSPSSW